MNSQYITRAGKKTNRHFLDRNCFQTIERITDGGKKWLVFHFQVKIQLTEQTRAWFAPCPWRERRGINCKSWNCQLGERVGSSLVLSATLPGYLLAPGLTPISEALYICQLHTCRQLYALQSISIWHSIEQSTMVLFSPAIDSGHTLQMKKQAGKIEKG